VRSITLQTASVWSVIIPLIHSRHNAKDRSLGVSRDIIADDCALVAHTLADAQILYDRFNNAARRFGLTLSLKKTEAMCQSYPPHQTASASITAGNDGALKFVDKFCCVAVSCPTSSQQTATSHSVSISLRQAALLVNFSDDCGACMMYPRKQRLPYLLYFIY